MVMLWCCYGVIRRSRSVEISTIEHTMDVVGVFVTYNKVFTIEQPQFLFSRDKIRSIARAVGIFGEGPKIQPIRSEKALFSRFGLV